MPDPYQGLRSQEEFRKFLQEDRTAAVRLLMTAKAA